ncbi:hypothetical protein C1922_07500 [Stenotrophomonas sp. ZAC14D2_NAIMI4_7]|uniref:hypothetical protein n=1 Tax=Stenotrophomonas sp. ZAC14D2_NAIMI4_7 TaxID=2072405 RepID=UPI000D53DC23|nr:hypothetical protein [Stenotrophomonas sp. ZAC14D2_NAIMI4_7]AWH17171.1 hypothetical protein C1922_07500 [Stenotrophomonas sp. ZAC14D2_NAIMI4_7]
MSDRSPRLYCLAAAVIWLAVMAALIHAGAQHDYWLQRSLDADAPQPYATGMVVTFALMSTVEIAVALLIVRPWRWRRLWLRLLIAFALLLTWSVPFAMGAMHQSPVYGTHLLWLLLLDLGLFLALCAVSVISAWQAFRRRASAARGHPSP